MNEEITAKFDNGFMYFIQNNRNKMIQYENEL